MKPRLYFHIGSPKTGTTAFQHYLNDNFDILLKGLRLYYPFCEQDSLLSGFHLMSGSEDYFSINEVRHNNGQRILACSDPFSLLARIGDVAREEKVDVVISDESLSVFSHPGSPLVSELKRLFDVTPIVVIRDPLEYVFSAYLESIKFSHYCGSFHDFVHELPVGSPQFRFYKEWCEAFPAIRVLSFKLSKSNLLGDIFRIFGRADQMLIAESGGLSARKNVSLDGECYAVLRMLNRNGLPALARKFALLYEESGGIGGAPKPDSSYYSAVYSCHSELFEYLSKCLNINSAEFLSECHALASNGYEVLPTDRFSGKCIEVLLKAMKEVGLSELARLLHGSACSSSEGSGADSFRHQDQVWRPIDFRKDGSPWERFCPAGFSVEYYLESSGILHIMPCEEIKWLDPYRHYVMYGRYSGYAVKRGLSVIEQVELFRDSPFVSYVPNGFDAETYLSLHHDVRAAGVDPYHHYWAYGVKEARLFY